MSDFCFSDSIVQISEIKFKSGFRIYHYINSTNRKYVDKII